MLRYVIVTLTFSFIFIYQANSGDSNMIISEILPLKEGNYWKYSSITDNDDSNQSEASIKIENYIGISDQDWFMTIFSRGKDRKSIDTLALANRDDGLWLCIYYRLFSNETYNPFLLFKYPTFAGDRNTLQIPKQGIVIHTLKTKVVLKVKAGTFKCIDYYLKSENIHIYVCPNIGIIKIESSSKEKKKKKHFGIELTEYKIN